MQFGAVLWATSYFVAFFATFKVTEGCGLISSPSEFDLNEIFSLLFGCQSEQTRLKFDRDSGNWVETCPDVECKYGMDDQDVDVCPTCLLGPGEKCGDWTGKCGDGMVCQYASMFACDGTCVSEEEFKSRKEGDSCGFWEGECGSGLKCRIEPDFLTFMCGIEESGVCVTEEAFSSRGEGETCGDTAGTCSPGLICFGGDFPWEPSKCVDPDAEDKLLGKPFGEIQAFDKSPGMIVDLSEDGDGHIVVESVTKEEEDGENSSDFVEKILKPEIEDGVFPAMLMEEVAMIENLIESTMKESNDSNIGDETETIIEVFGVPGDEEGETFMITMETMEPDKTMDDDITLDESITTLDTKPDDGPKVMTVFGDDFKEKDDANFPTVFDFIK